MCHKLFLVGLLLLVGVGCRACGSGCYDYLPPVADGTHTVSGGRAGSAFGPQASSSPKVEQDIPDPAVEVAQYASSDDDE